MCQSKKTIETQEENQEIHCSSIKGPIEVTLCTEVSKKIGAEQKTEKNRNGLLISDTFK